MLAVMGLAFSASVVAQAAESSHMIDVALGPNGSLAGQLVDDAGNGVSGMTIEITGAGDQAPVARTVTDNSGRFRLAGLHGGVYKVASADAEQLTRLWANNTAPPAAGAEMLMVAGSSTVRSQGMFGSMGSLANLGLVGVSVTSVTLAAVTMNEISNLQHKIDNLPSS